MKQIIRGLIINAALLIVVFVTPTVKTNITKEIAIHEEEKNETIITSRSLEEPRTIVINREFSQETDLTIKTNIPAEEYDEMLKGTKLERNRRIHI